jgi:hypothetical protein
MWAAPRSSPRIRGAMRGRHLPTARRRRQTWRGGSRTVPKHRPEETYSARNEADAPTQNKPWLKP